MAYTAERAYELVASAHERGRLAHAFLISGAPGSGKEHLAARIIAAGTIQCGFGKHNGIALQEMAPSLVSFWAARELKPYNGRLSEIDVDFKAAAALWERGLNEPDLLIGYDAGSVYETEDAYAYPDDDIPF